MVGALTDAVTATLGSGAHTFEHRSCVNEHGFNIELAGFGFALIFLFPVSDSRAEEFFDLASCFLIRELQYTEGFEQLQDASSKYFVDNSSIWSPQHGYKLNSEAAIIVTPKDLQVSIEGNKVYGMHALEDYYVAALKYKKQYAERGTDDYE